jgi:hypothetical protein
LADGQLKVLGIQIVAQKRKGDPGLTNDRLGVPVGNGYLQRRGVGLGQARVGEEGDARGPGRVDDCSVLFDRSSEVVAGYQQDLFGIDEGRRQRFGLVVITMADRYPQFGEVGCPIWMAYACHQLIGGDQPEELMQHVYAELSRGSSDDDHFEFPILSERRLSAQS